MTSFVKVSEKDIPELLEMMEAFYAIDHYPFDRSKSEKLMIHFLENEQLGRLWKIEHEGVSAGYVVMVFSFSFEHGGRIAIIDELFLKTRFRNRGLGKKAMKFIEDKARELGVKTLVLEVENHNEVGNRLYKHQGFIGKFIGLLTKKLD